MSRTKLQESSSFESPKAFKLPNHYCMPSPLLKSPHTPRYIPKLDSIKDLDRKFPPIEDADEMVGKAGLVYYAQSNPGQRKVAIKRQCLNDPTNKESIAYRELKIMQQLARTIAGTHNFISLLDWNKCWLKTSPKKNKKGSEVQCVNLIMDQAGEPLVQFLGKDKFISIYLFRQILFQVLYSLKKAQEACEFMHNDLHLRNILIDQPSADSFKSEEERWKKYESQDGNANWWIDSCARITIVDFGLSRISLPDGTVSHNNVHKIFIPTSDVEQIANEFSKFKISKWSDELFPLNSEQINKKTKRDIVSKMKKGVPLSKLIDHAFFSPLKVSPISTSELSVPTSTATPQSNTANAKDATPQKEKNVNIDKNDVIGFELPIPKSPPKPDLSQIQMIKSAKKTIYPLTDEELLDIFKTPPRASKLSIQVTPINKKSSEKRPKKDDGASKKQLSPITTNRSKITLEDVAKKLPKGVVKTATAIATLTVKKSKKSKSFKEIEEKENFMPRRSSRISSVISNTLKRKPLKGLKVPEAKKSKR